MMRPGMFEKVQLQKPKSLLERQESGEERSWNALSTGQSGTSVLDQVQSTLDDTGLSQMSTICSAPLCRQFWKSGSYDNGHSAKISVQNGTNYLHVHPMFLHSNATSHKWAFGAVAELLDNAVDEIQNGATFVVVDKTTNPRDGSPALLIQDDGGGMDPEALRRCMSFGFSDKKEKSAIGQYGNGFKTSTMRLGADVVVFSCHMDDGVLTQSIGLLSYTFLMQTGHDRIVVPMVDYKFNVSTRTLEMSCRYDREHFMANLSLLLQWSPYSNEADLVQQFDDIGSHGTKIIIYNLWFDDDGKMELDFDADPQDIRISGDIRKVETIPAWKSVNEQHIANRLHYSLRVYLSILYLQIPESFKIVLRGQNVERHNIADDLKYIEYILYRPQTAGFVEGEVVTTIGFLKEAPHVNIHGFNVYYKNRLILPFWRVVNYTSNLRGRGVVGVLEANFIEPTHNKQDFEKTSLFQKLEVRLKEMTWEYWDFHCGLIGYQAKKKVRASVCTKNSSHFVPHVGLDKPVLSGQSLPSSTSEAFGSGMKRKAVKLTETERANMQTTGEGGIDDNWEIEEIQPINILDDQLKDEEAAKMVQEHKKLLAKCMEYEKSEKELNDKLARLTSELGEAQLEYSQLLAEALSMGPPIKNESNVNQAVQNSRVPRV
ncbi:protein MICRORCHIDIA 6-like isoform X3 [Rhodamnia argentea]|uniref:Protein MICRORCHIDIA 6-like isoform X3 n=1 Tax=Rhodamnia argentea TaxID=178133 RepID=A0ABM3HIK3_9MYRT|nr:protein MICRORCHIDIA 6-like isoform X3 [Rhodamnia argentea]